MNESSYGHCVQKGDIEYEKQGVLRKVTYKRINKVVNGFKYSGEKSFLLWEKPLNFTALGRANFLIDEINTIKQNRNAEFSSFKIEIENSTLKLYGIINSTDTIKGLGGNIRVYQGYERCISEQISLVPFDISASNFRTRATISKRLADMLLIKENAFDKVSITQMKQLAIAKSKSKVVGVFPLVYEYEDIRQIEEHFSKFITEVKVLYLFMGKDNIHDTILKNLSAKGIAVKPIPEDMIKIYRQIIRMR